MEALTETLQQYLGPVFVMSISVVILTFFSKKITELIWPHFKKKKLVAGTGKEITHANTYKTKMAMWWNEVILYAIPVVFGSALTLSGSDWLFGDVQGTGGRMLFGAAVGWFSSFFYKIFRKMVLKKTGVDIQPGSINVPPPGAGT